MKTKINMYITSSLIGMMMCLPALIGCSKDNNNTEIVKPPLPPIEVDYSNMFGVNVYTSLGGSLTNGSDPGVTKEISTDLIGAIGIKSVRMNFSLSWLLEYSNGELRYREDNVAIFKEYIRLLKENGVVNILGVNSAYLIYPQSGLPRSYWKAIPDPEKNPEIYLDFLELHEKQCRMVAERFPEITHFEYGNEMSVPNGHNLNKNGFVEGASAAANAPFVFTDSELAAVTADLGYYTTRGFKAGNSNAKIVLPGLYLMVPEDTRNHVNSIYEHIESGNFPTTRIVNGNREIPADTDPDNYFEYQNWHPYLYAEHSTDWLKMNESLYQVSLDHGHTDVKIFITEFGYYDSFLPNREEVIANSCVPAIKALTGHLPAIESVFIFRMFNWMTAYAGVADMEKSFGIFDSPIQPNGARPKPVAISLFYYFNGANANSDPLFKYMK
jgi:hypothetical protein